MFAFYPLAVMLPASAIYAAITYDLSRGEAVLLPVVVGIVTVWMWRIAREGIYVGADGVRIRRLLGSTALRWDEIRQVDDGLREVYGANIRFHTIDGRVVKSTVQPTGAAVDRYAPMLSRGAYLHLVQQLRDLHDASHARR
ncbi:PH domain-containing protein [Catellatospora aurea]|uniref:PH domain-containing protein n=1 Tax=Catellatospora aurea TaxID=1337874 RepID=A0ABW2GSV4_9ACTN